VRLTGVNSCNREAVANDNPAAAAGAAAVGGAGVEQAHLRSGKRDIHRYVFADNGSPHHSAGAAVVDAGRTVSNKSAAASAAEKRAAAQIGLAAEAEAAGEGAHMDSRRIRHEQ